jgi:glycosyltransferase involved in cell wall biosynthesis
MSIIGIDASRANYDKRTGTEWYAYHLIQELKKVVPGEHKVVLYSTSPLKDGLEQLPPNWESRVLRWPPKRLWTQVRLSWEMLRRPPDVLFVPVHAMPVVLPKRAVTTLHDVAFMTTPEAYSPFENWYQRFAVRHAAKRAGVILTVSDFSKSEIMRHFRVKPEKIVVTHLGYDAERCRPVSDPKELEARLSRYGISRPYFLFVGRLEVKKNLSGLLRAFKHFHHYRRPGASGHQLILAGKRGYGYGEAMQALAGSEAEWRVKEVGYVRPDDLRHLYAGADALVFPSWYEGFGLPVIEAMACGTAVIASWTSSIPEVAGDAALLVDPASAEYIAEAMKKVAFGPGVRQELVAKGLARAKLFSWRSTAEKTWQALSKTL